MRLAIDQPFFQLDASQLSGTTTPSFVWQPSGTMSGIVPLQIVDAYVAGVGELEVRIAGSIPVASAGGPETAKGEAMRFLAELPWNPDAVLNADGLTWRQIDETSVEVSVETSGGQARVTMLFDEAGDITAIEADDVPGPATRQRGGLRPRRLEARARAIEQDSDRAAAIGKTPTYPAMPMKRSRISPKRPLDPARAMMPLKSNNPRIQAAIRVPWNTAPAAITRRRPARRAGEPWDQRR